MRRALMDDDTVQLKLSRLGWRHTVLSQVQLKLKLQRRDDLHPVHLNHVELEPPQRDDEYVGYRAYLLPQQRVCPGTADIATNLIVACHVLWSDEPLQRLLKSADILGLHHQVEVGIGRLPRTVALQAADIVGCHSPKILLHEAFGGCPTECSLEGIEYDSHGLMHILLVEMLGFLPPESLIQMVCRCGFAVQHLHISEQLLEAHDEVKFRLAVEVG